MLMKYIFSLFFLLLLSTTTYAQPSNDDCSGVIDLGTAPVCNEDVFFTNINATPTDIGNDNQPGCFASNPPSNDVWFQFQADAAITDYTVTIVGSDAGPNMDALNNVQFAIYRGFCGEDFLFLNDCVVGSLNQQVLSLDLTNLTPGEIYYVRVDNFGDNADEGDFSICVEEKVNSTIDEGFSNACSGTLYDTGGPDENYSDNEDNVFTICPAQLSNCLTFELAYYNIEPGSDNIIFYNGPDTDSPVITDFSGFGGQQGGGGVCLTVQADSCLTIQFISDGSTTAEGFEANWNCSVTECETLDALTVDTGAENETIEDAISTSTAIVVVDTVICDSGAYGTFSMGDDTNLGLGKGLLLTSGSPDNAIGPNNSGSAGTNNGASGDDDLDVLSELFGNNNSSQDACVVEVDVTVFADKLEFEYIFGSEEYPEFVNSNFNDIFALLISGPGIDGIVDLNNQENMAVIPGSTTPIQINSVNNLQNWEYYRDNNNGVSVEYDGLTSGFLGDKKSLTASAVVMPCSTYHLKFAIADRGDGSFDSGVFISEIRSGTPEIQTQFVSGLDYFVEKCLAASNDTVIIELDEALPEETSYTITIGGTATEPDDYIFDIPDTITFGVGQTILKFPIEVFNDDITEGDETVTISMFRNFGCGDILISELVIPIRENILVEIETEQDSLIACSDSPTQLMASGATSYLWSPFNAFDNPFISNPVVNAGFEGWVYVEGKIDPFTSPECIGMDSIYINLVEPMVSIKTDDLQICEGEEITFTAINNVNNSNLTWVILNNFQQVDDPNAQITTWTPTFGFVGSEFQVSVSVELGGCIASDTVIVQVDPYDALTPIFSDTMVCQGEQFPLNQFAFIYGTSFSIDPEDNVIDPEDPFTEVIADESIDYQVITSSPSMFCSDTLNYSIEVIPNEISINQGDSVRICLGETLDLTTLSNPTDAIITWVEADSINANGGSAEVNPAITTEYKVIADNGACMTADSITVYVDSLPNMEITAIPERNPYCKDEIITFTSPGYKDYQFPNIMHTWSPTTGFQDDSQNDYNVGLAAVESTTYIRTTVNGACTAMDTFEITVIDPSITLNIEEATICQGESVDFELASEFELENIEWSSGSGTFTCDDCESTTLNNVQNSTTVEVEVDADGCPTSAMAEVTVIRYSGNIITTPKLDCNFFGDILTLTANWNPELPEGTIVEWFLGDELLEEFTNQDSIVIMLPGDDGSGSSETFLYSWRVTDLMGCTSMVTTEICAESRFAIPDAFSPGNNDGNNDFFRIVDKGEGLSSVEILAFRVFNRWGQRVYNCETFECAVETGWDGTFNDVEQPGGTYMFYIEMRYPDGNTRKYEGDLLLLK